MLRNHRVQPHDWSKTVRFELYSLSHGRTGTSLALVVATERLDILDVFAPGKYAAEMVVEAVAVNGVSISTSHMLGFTCLDCGESHSSTVEQPYGAAEAEDALAEMLLLAVIHTFGCYVFAEQMRQLFVNPRPTLQAPAPVLMPGE